MSVQTTALISGQFPTQLTSFRMKRTRVTTSAAKLTP
jgi:hypothetical protein